MFTELMPWQGGSQAHCEVGTLPTSSTLQLPAAHGQAALTRPLPNHVKKIEITHLNWFVYAYGPELLTDTASLK